ncbi:MAG: ABC-2 transporter permease [Candidatus Thermoplasmatota archaeon]
MKLARSLAISRKQFLTLRHDPRSLGLILVAPIFAMLVFGFAFGAEVSHVPVVIVNHDTGAEAAAFIAKLDRTALDVHTTNFDSEARSRVLDTRAVAAITFPANFTEGVTPRAGTPPTPGAGGTPVGAAPGTAPQPPPGTTITVFMDGTNTAEAQVVARALAIGAKAYAESKGGTSPIAIDTQAAYAKDARFIDFFVPGVMGFAALMFTTLLTLLAFVGERTNGTLDRLRVTPATEAEIVLGYVITFGLVGAVQGLVLLSAAILIFHVLVVGSILVAGLVIVLLAIDAQAIGILLSAAAQREGQAVQMIPLIILPTFLLSGLFIPVSNLPNWLQPFAYLLPPTWAIDAMRDVMLRGWGLEGIWLNVLVLLGFAVGFTGLAIVSLKRARA